MIIHKEGTTTIALCILFIFVLNALIQFYFPQAHSFKVVVYIISFLLFVATVFVFRNPGVAVAINDKAVLCPADGKVITIQEVDETEFFMDKRLQVSIATSPFHVHVNRNPVAGIVKYFKFYAKQNSSANNAEHTTIAIESSTGSTVLMRQFAGGFGSRIACYIKQGDSVAQGTPFGYNKMGSRVDVLLPISTKLNVQLNQAVKGGTTILAELKA